MINLSKYGGRGFDVARDVSEVWGDCRVTVHEGSVRKYLEMRSLFESDKVKRKGLAGFM